MYLLMDLIYNQNQQTVYDMQIVQMDNYNY